MASSSASKKTRVNQFATPFTYSGGFVMNVEKPIKKREFIEICNEVTEKLYKLYPGRSIRVVPEDITEGGFEIRGLPSPQYKSMRICNHVYDWPGVTPATVMDEWERSTELLLPIQKKLGTCLKAFHGAPVWTREELQIFVDVLRNHEIICKKLPSHKNLTSYGSLGSP